MKTLAILGASGHGKVLADAALCSNWDNVVFFDDAWQTIPPINNWKIMGSSNLLIRQAHQFDGIALAIGDNNIRYSRALQLLDAGINLTTIIHPKATISRYARVESGSVIFAGAVLNSNCQIGRYCIINTNATVEHDCILGPAVHISPGSQLAGQVHIGELSWIGIGAIVRQMITIGKQVIVGAGTVVVKHVPDNCTVFGVPAKIMLKREE